MPRVLLVCLLSMVLGAAALPSARPARAEAIFAAFDAAALGPAERRLLQAALAATGDYAGALDGAWGAASRRALGDYAAREFEDAAREVHAAALLLGFTEELAAGGWAYRHEPELGLSVALPLLRLLPPEAEEGGRRWWSRDGGLTVLMHRFDAAEAAAWHAAAVEANADPAALRTLRAADRMLTLGRLGDGRVFQARSDRVAGGWATVHLVAEPAQARAMNLIAASIRPGAPLDWELPAGGRLARIVAATAGFLDRLAASGAPPVAPPQSTALPPKAGGAGAATGTGFYLGAHVLVTAEHVVRDCGRVALPDGTGLTLIAADPTRDVAALEAPRPARAWLRLAPAETRLGQRLHAAGFPYYSIAGTALHLTGGNVSALAGVDDDARFFSFSAPVQPGNSGGPLIGPGGAVLGVAVARLSESFIAEATGSLPQNVNYALRAGEIAAFLERHGLAPAAGGLGGFDVEAGAPEALAEAVVPLLCE